MRKVIMRLKAQMKEAVQVSLETFEEAKGQWLSLELPLVPHERAGMHYYVSNAAILKHLQMSSKTPAIMVAQPLDKSKPPMIIINTAFEIQLPVPYQEAMMAHEVGHIKYEHLKQKHYNTHPAIYVLKRAFGHKGMLRNEFEADAYSQSQGHAIVGALQWMINNIPQLNRRELKLRIANLTSLNAGGLSLLSHGKE